MCVSGDRSVFMSSFVDPAAQDTIDTKIDTRYVANHGEEGHPINKRTRVQPSYNLIVDITRQTGVKHMSILIRPSKPSRLYT